MEEFGKPIRHQLAGARNWWRITRLFSSVAWAVALLILLGLICFHIDKATPLSAAAREAWRSFIIGGSCLLLFGLALIYLLRRLPDSQIASAVEKKFPVLKERLLTTIDMLPGINSPQSASPEARGFSPAMVKMLAQETSRDAKNLPFTQAISLRPLRAAAMVSLFSIIFLALQIFASPGAFANWLRRMASPRDEIAPWANTQVWVKPLATVLPRGAGVEVMVNTQGGIAHTATLFYRSTEDAQSPWKTMELSRPANGTGNQRRFRHHFATLPQSTVFYAKANDGRSDEKKVLVEDRPSLMNVKMTFNYPAYMKRTSETRTLSDGNVTAPYGTEIAITANTNKPVKTAQFEQKGANPITWRVNRQEVFGNLSIRKDTEYTVRLVDTHGFASQNPPKYEVRSQQDQTPSVQIERPSSDIDLQPDGSMPLVTRANDDYGVTQMSIAYETQHEATMGGKSVGNKGSLPLPGTFGKPAASVATRWHIGVVKPKPGDTISYWVTATDNDNLSGPHIGKSSLFRVHVVSLQEMQKRLADRMAQEQSALAQLRKMQIEAQQMLRKAKQKPDAASITKASEAERSVGQEAKALAQRLADTSAQLENNKLASPSELQRRNEAQNLVNNVGQQKAPTASDQISQAKPQNPKASPNRDALASAEKKEGEIQRDIEAAQQKLSPVSSPEELAKELARLAKDQQERADASRTISEDLSAEQRKNPGKPLPPEYKAALDLEKQNQAALTKDTQRAANQLRSAAKSAAERGEKRDAESLNKAAEALEKGNVAGNQKDAQQNLSKNNPTGAVPKQDKAAAALQQAANRAQEVAQGNNNETPNQTADRLEKAAEQLRGLAKEQQDLANQAKQSPNSAQSKQLGNQQQNLQNRTQQATQNLQNAQQAQQTARNAQQNQQSSSSQLSKSNPQAAQQPAQTAAQQLEQAANQAEQAANRMRQQAQAEEMAEKVSRLAQIQRGLQGATDRLDKAQQRGPLSSNELRELGNTQARQRNLEDQAKTLSESAPSPAFKQALQQAAKEMQPASRNLSLNKPNTGEMTQQAQNRAAQTLETIADALRMQAQAAPNGQQNQQNGQQAQSGSSPEQMQQAAALGELMLAKGMQQQIRQNTARLEKQRQSNPNQTLNPAQQAEAGELAQGEQRTSEVARNAASQLRQIPGVERAVQEADRNIGQARQQLQQQQTGQPTQSSQDAASRQLDAAVKATQQAMQQQQQQQQANAGGMPMPMPSNQPGNQPDRNGFTRLGNNSSTGLNSAAHKDGKGFGDLNPRQQRIMKDGRNDRVAAEYRELVKRYFGENRGK